MKYILTTLSLIALTGTSASALASTKFKETITVPAATPLNIVVELSEDMAHRANALPKELRDRGRARSPRDGFSGNGFYGEKDLAMLTEDLREEFVTDLTKAGLTLSDTAALTLKVTITDARPSRPTFRQLSVQPGLSFQSIARGGATIESQLIDASGQVIGTSEYGWYDEDAFDGFGAVGTWNEAKRAFSRYARHTAKTIKD